MQIRMAHPAAGHADQNFSAARDRTIRNRFAQRLPVGNKRLAAKFAHAVLSPEKPAFSIALKHDPDTGFPPARSCGCRLPFHLMLRRAKAGRKRSRSDNKLKQNIESS